MPFKTAPQAEKGLCKPHQRETGNGPGVVGCFTGTRAATIVTARGPTFLTSKLADCCGERGGACR